ncbi:hypothetical protein [Hymenobacter edaphi]|uniref:Uncharacterized protein n=1 Tax=Hymenobacter edaphi TaxID=2211146 RepID=A0A328BXG3_9BACT|nr:hypothetical protein [Hymenobacter edaphi]RAK70554.1 hypothetical protein DLM85_06885 [Hymenobacter edaphi]
MTRHERTLLLIGTVLITSMAVLRISHYISASVALTLLVFGGLFAAAAVAGHHKRLKAQHTALRTRQGEAPAARP